MGQRWAATSRKEMEADHEAPPKRFALYCTILPVMEGICFMLHLRFEWCSTITHFSGIAVLSFRPFNFPFSFFFAAHSLFTRAIDEGVWSDFFFTGKRSL
ncbi:hypothetical protein TRVL_08261 [Trypanosoma vivax]|nr:hypothetical protein TRVL_08261 [Trypanosoma vivax]